MLWEHLVQVQQTSTHLVDYICTHIHTCIKAVIPEDLRSIFLNNLPRAGLSTRLSYFCFRFIPIHAGLKRSEDTMGGYTPAESSTM